jgi:DNA-3-methyladenine glycosylase
MVRTRPFPRDLLALETQEAARRLLGARLTRDGGPEVRVGRIVEVEAYIGQDDLASHARFGRTKRNSAMFGPPGAAYVYLVYGMYHCLNVVTEPEGRAAALLVRAVEPTCGHDLMRAARLRWAQDRAAGRSPGARDEAIRRIEEMPADRLASGPGLVCAAFSIDRTQNGVDLCDPASELRLEIAGDDVPAVIETGPRVGVDYAPDPWRSRPWRFFVPGSPSVSAVAGPRRGSAA